jgi:hypothetical protein
VEGDPINHPEIRIFIDTREPVTGQARAGTGEAVPFQGWLDLLKVLSELLAPHPGPSSPGG